MTHTSAPTIVANRRRLAVALPSLIGFEAVRADDPQLPISDVAKVRQATRTVADVFEARAARARTPKERAAVPS
jgi:hypothetical protein